MASSSGFVAAGTSTRCRALLALLGAILLAGSGVAEAQTIALLGGSDTGFTGLANNNGFEFSTPTAIRVTELGFFDLQGDGLAAPHEVGIWRVSDQTLMVSATVPAGTVAPLDGDYRYVAVTATELDVGSYILSAVTTGDTWPINLVNPVMSGALQYVRGANNFPAETVALIYPNQVGGNERAPANFKLEVIPPAGAESYEYDPLGRITRVTTPGGTIIDYTYDPAGNILERTVPEPDALAALLAGIVMLALFHARGPTALRRRRAAARAAAREARPRARWIFSTIAAAFVLCWAPNALAQGTARPQESRDWREAVREYIANAEYEVRWKPTRLRRHAEAWQAGNRAQNLRTHFVDEGIRVTPRVDAQWEFGLSLLSYGRGDAARPTLRRAPQADGHAVRYQRGDLEEWFVNQREGLKQGFTLNAPPRAPRGPATRALGLRAASRAGETAPVYVALRVDGDAHPVLAADRQSVDFVRSGSPLAIAHYSQLEVRDASERLLDSWMEVFEDEAGHGIRLVFDDGGARYPVEIDPLLTTPDWRANGNTATAALGFSVAGAGDVNADGFDDVLVGAPGFDGVSNLNPFPSSGRAYLFLGTPGGLSLVPIWFSEGGFPRDDGEVGTSVAGAGDVDGDGFDDIVVSRAGLAYGVINERIFLYRGSPLGPSLTEDWYFEGREGFGLGTSVAGAGDLNGDGLDDIVVGEPGTTANQGRVYVFYGEANAQLGGGVSCLADDATLSVTCNPVGTPVLSPTVWGAPFFTDVRFGERVAGAGDVNCDGFDDLVFGQPDFGGGQGRINVFYGGAAGVDTNSFFNLIGSALDSGGGAGDGQVQLGRAVAGIGPLDASSVCEDILVGAPGRDQLGRIDAGAVYLIRGVPGVDPVLTVQNSLSGQRAFELFGTSLARVGDVNDDGAEDVLVGAPGASGAPTSAGRAYLFLGPIVATFLDRDPVWRVDGEQEGDHLGYAVAHAGDVDADQLGDLLIGSPSRLWNTAATGPGSATAYFGTAPAPVYTLLGLDAGTVVDSFAWGGSLIADPEALGEIDPTSQWSPFISGGPGANSLLVSTGLALDDGRGGTDWEDDTLPDQASTGLLLEVPVGARTLRFTTQYVTSDPDQEPRNSARLRYQYGGPLSNALAESLDPETPIEEAGRGETHSPISHAIDVTDEGLAGGQVAVQLVVTDTDGSLDRDSAAILSKIFFTDVPLPDYLSDPTSSFPDANVNAIADYVTNPQPTELSSTAGTFRYTLPLLNVPGREFPFQFVLTYDSQRTDEDDLGPKWSHSFASRLQELSDFDSDGCADTVFLWLGNGVIEAFKEEDGATGPACTFEPSYPGVLSTLTYSDGFPSYDHRSKEKTRSFFSVDDAQPIPRPGDLLFRSRPKPNNAHDVIRDPGTGRIAAIGDARNELFSFAWDESFDPARIESVTGPGVQVRFTYDALGFLASAVDANGFETTFSYDQQGNLLTITDGDGVLVVDNEYESFAPLGIDEPGIRVVRQRNGNPGDSGQSTVFGDGDPTLPDDALEIRDRLEGVRFDRFDVFGRRVESRILLDSSQSTTLDDCDRTRDWCAVWSYRYNDLDQLVELTDPEGVVVQNEYDERGNLVCRTEDAGPGGSPVRSAFLYDARDNATDEYVQRLPGAANLPACPLPPYTEVDPADVAASRWLETTTTYDFFDNPLTRTDPDGRTTTFTYFPPSPLTGVLESIINAESETQSFDYDVDGNLSTITDAALGETSFTYDLLGQQTSVTDPRGFLTRETRSPGGQLITRIDPNEDPLNPGSPSLGGIELYSYDAQGRQLSLLDAAGELWTTSYTPTGRVAVETAPTDPEPSSRTYAYDAEGRLTRLTNERGFETTRSYDAAGRLLSVTDPLTGSFVFGHDKAGRRTSVTDPLGNETQIGFDSLGRRTLIRDALLNETSFTYDTRGNRLTRTDPNPGGAPIVWTRTYANSGALSSVVDPTGIRTRFERDEIDRVTRETLDPILRHTDFGYDPRGLLTDVTIQTLAEGVLATAAATYDASGNLGSITDPNGNPTEFEYDGLDRITLERDGEGHEIETTYDARGQIETRTNARNEVVAFSYDGASRRTGLAANDAATGSWSLVETLDGKGNSIETLGQNTGSPGFAPATVERVFDELDRQTVRTVELQPGVSRTTSSEYDAAGNLAAIVYSDGSRVDYEYDALNRLERVTDGARITNYEYDAVGNVTRILPPDGSETVYTYDLAGRLISIVDSGPSDTIFQAQFTLDNAGRRIFAQFDRPLEPLPEATETFTYDDANRMSTRSSQGTGLTHDADGNLVTATIGGSARTLEYNALNQLVEVDSDTTIRYDGDGLRVARTVGGVTTYYLYDTEGRLLEELDATGAVLARYVHGQGLISRAAAGAVSVYHYDSRGSTVALSDLEGDLTDTFAYSPFGAPAGRTGSTPNPFTYSGRDGVVDDGNGLFYMRARYYAPELMRFVQKDPVFAGELSRPQSLNRYAFVEGNPIELVDPTGEFGQLFTAFVGTLAGGLTGALVATIEGKDLNEILESAAQGAVAGAIIGATGGLGLLGGTFGGGLALLDGGSFSDVAFGAGIGALGSASFGAAVGTAFAEGFLSADGGLGSLISGDIDVLERLKAGGIDGGVALALGGLGAGGGKVLSKLSRSKGTGLTKRLARTRVIDKVAKTRAGRTVNLRLGGRKALEKAGRPVVPSVRQAGRRGAVLVPRRAVTEETLDVFSDELRNVLIEEAGTRIADDAGLGGSQF